MSGWQNRAPSGRIAYVDGRYVPHRNAAVHIEDRGLQLGDAIYEVCSVVDGRLMDEEEHLDRLERSVREIDMAMPTHRNVLGLLMRELVRRNSVRNGLLYLQVTRGAFRRDHAIPSAPRRPTLIMTTRDWGTAGTERLRASGVTVMTRLDERWARRDIKTTQLIPNLLAKTAARRAGSWEAWLVDAQGYVTEGSSTTAWIVDAAGTLITRDLSNDILPGVTRRVILEAASQAQMPVSERKFTPAEAAAGREAFISSATGVFPVTAIDGITICEGVPGPVTRRVQELYAQMSASRALKHST